MISSRLFKRSLAIQVIFSVVLALAALAYAGFDMAFALLAAGAVSGLDLLAMVAVAKRLAGGPLRGRIFYSVILGLKFPVLIGVVYLLVVILRLDPLGLVLGFSTLLIAILYASLSWQKLVAGGDRA